MTTKYVYYNILNDDYKLFNKHLRKICLVRQ